MKTNDFYLFIAFTLQKSKGLVKGRNFVPLPYPYPTLTLTLDKTLGFFIPLVFTSDQTLGSEHVSEIATGCQDPGDY